MKKSEKKLAFLRDQLGKLEAAVSSIRTTVLPVNPKLFEAMATSYSTEIALIRSEIDDLIGVCAAPSGFRFRLKGGVADSGQFDARYLSEVLHELQQAVFETAEMLYAKMRLIETLPSVDVRDSARLRIVALAPGSFSISLQVFRPQLMLFAREIEELGVSALREIAYATGGLRRGDTTFGDIVTRKALRHTRQMILAAAKGGSDISMAEISHGSAKEEVLLDYHTNLAIAEYLRIGIEPDSITINGTLRALDLDRSHFHVITSGAARVKCRYSSEEFEDIVKQCVDLHVVVTGIARYRKDRPKDIHEIKVNDIQLVDSSKKSDVH